MSIAAHTERGTLLNSAAAVAVVVMNLRLDIVMFNTLTDLDRSNFQDRHVNTLLLTLHLAAQQSDLSIFLSRRAGLVLRLSVLTWRLPACWDEGVMPARHVSNPQGQMP